MKINIQQEDEYTNIGFDGAVDWCSVRTSGQCSEERRGKASSRFCASSNITASKAGRKAPEFATLAKKRW